MSLCCRVTELHCKEVICISDGQRLGFVSDVLVQLPDGCVTAIVVPGPGSILNLGRRDDFVIPWKCIRRIGADIVLVDIKPDDCRSPRPKLFSFLP